MITNDKHDKYLHTTFLINMITIDIGNHVLKVCMSSFIYRQTICASHCSTATKPAATASHLATGKSYCSSTKINKVKTALKLNYI